MSSPDEKLDAMVVEATVDCHDADEAVLGLYTMMQDNLKVPFQTSVLGVEVTVSDIDLSGNGQIVALCDRGLWRQPIPVLDLPLPQPAPVGAEWIDAYRRWCG